MKIDLPIGKMLKTLSPKTGDIIILSWPREEPPKSTSFLLLKEGKKTYSFTFETKLKMREYYVGEWKSQPYELISIIKSRP